MNHFESLATDIGDLVPGLNDALYGGEPGKDVLAAVEEVFSEPANEIVDEEVDEEVNEEVEENSSEETTQTSESVDNEVKPNEAPDALGEALARLSAQESLNKSLRSDLEAAQVRLEAPVFVPYDELPEDIQREFDAVANKAGIDPRVIVYNHFQRILAEHDHRVRNLGNQREAATSAAMMNVDKFFDDHPMKAKHGAALLESLKANPGWKQLSTLAQRDPDAFQVAATAMLDAGFRKAEADAAFKQRTLKQQKTLRESTRTEASRATSTSPTAPKPQQGEINAASMAQFITSNTNSLNRFFK